MSCWDCVMWGGSFLGMALVFRSNFYGVGVVVGLGWDNSVPL